MSDDILGRWSALNEYLLQADEPTLKALLDRALDERRNRTVVLRVFHRYNKLRAQREKMELLSACNNRL